MVSGFSALWLKWVTDYPKTVIGLLVGFLILAAVGLPRFKLDASADSLTLEHDKDLTYFRQMSKQFGSGDFLIVTYTPKQDLFSDPSLSLLRDLQDELAQIEGISNVNSILNVPLLYSPKRSLREIAKDPQTLESPGVDRNLAKQEFLTSPIYRDMILGPDGQTTALQLNIGVDRRYIELVQKRDELRLKRDTSGLTAEETEQLNSVSQAFLEYRTQSQARGHRRVEDVRAVVAKYQDRAQIFVGGITMITADMITYIRKDLVIFGSAAVAFMILVLAIIFRSLRFVVIPMASCLAAVFIMLGLISWLDWRLTVISSNFVALLLIISLAIIIHLVVRYREYLQENPQWSRKELVEATLIFMARPCLYTALTTIVAFVSLVVSDIRPVIDFGWMMTIGLVFALSIAFLLLPACLMLLPKLTPPASVKSNNQLGKEAKPLTLYCSTIVERFGGSVLLVSGLIGVLSIWGISRLQVENRFIDYFHEDTEIHQGLSVIDNKLGGTTTLDIIINSKAAVVSAADTPPEFTDEDDPFAEADPFDESDPFDAPSPITEEDAFAEADPFSEHGAEKTSYWMTVAGMETVKVIHDYLDSMPEIGKVQSLATLYEVGLDMNGSLNNFELAVMDKSLSPEIRRALVGPFLFENGDTRITMRVKDSYPDLQRAELVERIRQHLQQNTGLDMQHVKFSGLLVLYNNMLQSLFSSQIVTLGAVFLGIMVMFVILFRSLLIAVVAIVPNILAALSILGTMGLAGIPLDMMTITIAAITVGIGVDDTIHYIHRFKTELSIDGNYIAAMHRSHGSIGRAMYYTSVIIIFGFSIMVLSEFIPTIYFGILTGLAMLAALAGALFLLPKLILIARPFKSVEQARKAVPKEDTSEVFQNVSQVMVDSD